MSLLSTIVDMIVPPHEIAAEADSFNESDSQAFNNFEKDVAIAINRLMNESRNVPNVIYTIAAAFLVKYVDLVMTASIPKKKDFGNSE
jgi:hypothetical protein